MNDFGDSLPVGFQGPVKAWSGLVPAAERVLRLPCDRSALAARDAGYDLIEVQAVTESLGRIEDALADLAARLVDGGTLLLDVDNVQSERALRLVLEGRPGSFDPAGSTDDPSQLLALRRVVAAATAAGLHVVDVIAVPAPPGTGVDAGFANTLFARGLLPIEWVGGPPPARFWLDCRKASALAGSVLIAGGDAADRQRTERCLQEYLPSDWEILDSAAHRECAQWNRAVSVARGEVVWFLRGGAEPTADSFATMSARAGIGAVVPGRDGVPASDGDLAGTMMPRADVLFVGPLSETVANTRIALEEYLMRLGAKLPAPEVVDVELPVPPVAVEEPASFARETATLLARWRPATDATTTGDGAADVDTADAGPGAKTAAAAPWAGRRPKVSLCMIARDEERFLPECLRRARAAVDEIVLVDTGSTDSTVAIAESFGAKVLHETWQDDFSAPRNTALRAATGDWILVLDADEFLLPEAPARIRELVESADVSGYHMRFTNLYTGGKTIGVMMVRLFRNLPGIAYQNVIHEQVTPSLQREGSERGLVLSQADVEVEHHGYSDEIMDARGKNERNERLFRKQMAATPEDVYTHYKYGDFLRRVPGRGADARRLLERCLELILAGPPALPRGLPYASEVAALCALENARCGEMARAREILDIALRRFVPTPNLFYLSASLALSEGRGADAIAYYRRCLAYRGQVLVVPVQEGITSYVALTGIAQAWMLRKDFARARPLLEQAIEIHPAYEVAHLALSNLWLQQGDVQRALRVLTAFLAAHPDSPGTCQQITLILHRLGRTAEARRLGRHAVQMLEARALDHEAAQMDRFLAAI
ncbi:MAG: glycosyltransferase [Planctomycetes bacterium]|nr:glycosyltransferase [Planctomycetota bacterium]